MTQKKIPGALAKPKLTLGCSLRIFTQQDCENLAECVYFAYLRQSEWLLPSSEADKQSLEAVKFCNLAENHKLLLSLERYPTPILSHNLSTLPSDCHLHTLLGLYYGV